MKTWHIITSEYPPDVGGVSDYTRQVAEALAGSGDQVHVWCPGTSRTASTRADGDRVWIHTELGRIRRGDLRRVDALIDSYPSPRRVLVQWVPHGFGYRSMNVWFCLWLAKRARRGDCIELMVHEPYLEFRLGPMRHLFMACVHRLMTVVLLRAASRVWLSTPAWEPRLRPYAFGRNVAMEWLPVPACVASHDSRTPHAIRRRYATSDRPVVGHFGSYGALVTTMLDARLPAIMDSPSSPALLLLGSGGEQYRQRLLHRHPAWSDRVRATGYLADEELQACMTACDVFVQPYPDGITSRRTSAMACLAHGRALVTTLGHLTEPFWRESDAATIVEVGDADGFSASVVRLLSDPHERRRIGARGQKLYDERFAVRHVIDALRAA